ncbi:hypothetical protein KAR91_08310 [Candidatus Pacearchaeota archaeon]|nr:hypothetical protein [Candidatus Pacearchaeota archaeon]
MLTLIDKQDNFEIVRDKIALILVNEIANQQVLAAAAGKIPNDWKMRVYLERTNPWEIFTNGTDKSPVINVWFDGSRFDGIASDTIERQKSDSIYNIDCYGCGVTVEGESVKQIPGDKTASLQAQKAVRLVRNILMSAEYAYLGLRGTVGKRWPQSINMFQPQIDNRAAESIVGARIAFGAEFNEFSPQITGEDAELISIDFKRAEDGEIVAEADYEYPI